MNNSFKVFGLALVLTMTLLTSSCLDDIICEQASGDFDEVILNLDDFDGIDLSISANVYLTEATEQTITVKGKSDAIAKLGRSVSNGVWDIDFDQCMNNHDLEIFILTPALNSIKISGSGDVIGQSNFTMNDPLKLRISGSGYVSLDVTTSDIDSKISGSGDIRLVGVADKHNLQISGSGDLAAFDLATTNTTAKITGSGNAEVFVDGGDLDATITGSGKIYYKGQPSSFNTSITGSGRVIDAN